MRHTEGCPRVGRWFKLQVCREFSTDGTRIGAEIAHLYGTMDDDEIKELQRQERIAERDAVLTGMEAEQADWEEGE